MRIAEDMEMLSLRVLLPLAMAWVPLILGWTPIAQSAYTVSNYLACINQTVERILCPGNQSMIYEAGDRATGAVPNCGLRYWEPTTALSRPAVKLLHPNILITNNTVIPLASNMTAWMEYPVGLDVVPSVVWTKEPLREFTERPEGIREAWFLDPVLTADMADEPVLALQDLSQLVLRDANLNWNGYTSFIRRFASVYDGKVIGLPVSAAVNLFYYRRDFFDANNLTVPATWEEVVELAERYNGTDLDGTGRGAWGFCLAREPRCYIGYTFQTMQVPFLQSEGTNQGFHFDPIMMNPLVNSTGTRRAAELYRRLSRFTAPAENVACLPISMSFVRGHCLMAVGTTLHFKYTTFNNQSKVRGKTGTALPPGSLEVMNRTTGRMVRCTPDRCPKGRWHTLQNGTRVWINVAPFAGRGAFTYAINRHREPHLQYIAYRLCARRVYPDAMWPSVLSSTAETTPVRTEMVDPANVGRYVGAGYDREDTLLFMDALSKTMEHDNIALNLRIYGALDYYFAVDAQSIALMDNANLTVDQILNKAQGDVVKLYSNVSAEWLKQRYFKSIDRPLPKSSPPEPKSGMDARVKVGIGVGVGLGGALLLAGLVVLSGVVVLRPAFEFARNRKAYVPYASLECTLVVTDMEGSTNLWEAYPAEVMQTALQMHDGIARRTLKRHKGYESATEGDSFIVAFPNAITALRFALDFQAELMAADWPPVLLQASDLCRPVYAVARGGKDAPAQLSRRSRSLLPRHGSLAPRSNTPQLPTTSTPSDSTSFKHISGVSAAIAAAASSTTPGPNFSSSASLPAPSKARSGHQLLPTWSGVPSLHHQQQQQQQQHQPQGGGMPPSPFQHPQQQPLEGQSAQGLASLLGDIPEQYAADNPSMGSLGSLGFVGRVPSGFFRKPSLHAAISAAITGGSSTASGGATSGPQQPPARLMSSARASPLSAPPRTLFGPQLGSHLGGGAAAAAAGASAAAVAAADSGEASPSSHASDVRSFTGGGMVTRGGSFIHSAHASVDMPPPAEQPPPQQQVSPRPPQQQEQEQQQPHSQQAQAAKAQLVQGKGTADDPGHSAQLTDLMGSDPDLQKSLQGGNATWSGVLMAGASTVGQPDAATAAPLPADTPSARSGLAASAVAGAAALGAAPVVAPAPAIASGGGCGSGAGRVNDTWTYGSEAGAGWQLLEAPAPGAVTVFRGLRIRIGLFSGVRPTELTNTKASARISFCGLAIRMGKAVSDAANGGMVVLSDTAAVQLLGVPEVASLLAGEGTEIWHLGRVKLAEDLRAVEMFQVMTPLLAPRLALQQPLRVKSQLLPGVLSAPAGHVALVRLHVSGLAALRASEPELAAEVAAVLEELLLESLPALGGYLSEARHCGEGGITVAFPNCLSAVAWALAVQADMLHWGWSQELLANEAFETIAVDASLGSSFSSTVYAGSELAAAVAGGAVGFAASLTAGGGGTGSGEIADTAAAAAGATRQPRTRMYGSPPASSTGIVAARALSFSSQAGRTRGGAGAAVASAAAGGGGGVGSFTSLAGAAAAGGRGSGGAAAAGGGGSRGGSFSSQTGRPQGSGGSRLLALAGSFSFSASFRNRSQRFMMRGPAGRKLAAEVEANAPSLLSPLQAPPELAETSPAPARRFGAPPAAERKTPARKISLPDFLRRMGTLGEEVEKDTSKEGRAPAGGKDAAAAAPADVESGHGGFGDGGVAAAAAMEDEPRLSTGLTTSVRETMRLAAVLGPVAGADAAAADLHSAGATITTITPTTITTATACPPGPSEEAAAVGGGDAAAGPVAEALDAESDTDPAAAAAAAATPAAAATRDESASLDDSLAAPGGRLSAGKLAPAAAVAAAAAAAAAPTSKIEAPGGSACFPDLPRAPSASSSITATTAIAVTTTAARQQVLFRGPRTKAVVDFGGVSTEICGTTGRLLYRGRMAKHVIKMMDTARWGQVLCTTSVFAQAAAVAPACGIAMAPLVTGGGGGGGRRKPVASGSRTGPGAFAKTGSATAPAVPSGPAGAGGGPLPWGVPAAESHAETAAGAAATPAKKAQYYLCSLTAPHGGAPAPPPPLGPRRDWKPPLPLTTDSSSRGAFKTSEAS